MKSAVHISWVLDQIIKSDGYKEMEPNTKNMLKDFVAYLNNSLTPELREDFETTYKK